MISIQDPLLALEFDLAMTARLHQELKDNPDGAKKTRVEW
jgi:hypothetical protein